MLRFWLFRLARTLPTTWGILSVIFLLSHQLATDQLLDGRLATGTLDSRATAAAQQRARQQVRIRLGLHLPLFYVSSAPPDAAGLAWRWRWNGAANQYHHWLASLLRADLGRSFRTQEPVLGSLLGALRATLPLTGGAALVTLTLVWLLAPWLGRRNRRRTLLLSGLYALDALPLFLVALLLLLLLANPDLLAWFPAYGMGRAAAGQPWGEQLTEGLYYLTLPLLSLVLASLPALAVQLDGALAQQLAAPYAQTARAKGLPERQVVRRHALRNALLPLITLLTELLPALLAGSVVVELVYSRPGMGRLLAEAAAARDYPVLLGGVLLLALARLLAQLLADGLYAAADPRIRLTA